MTALNKDATVFIVDDDQAVRDSLVYFLEFEGLNVKTYASAQDFMASDQSTWKGCLVLDVSMPGMNGLELQKVLAEKELDLPIIFITGHGDVPMSVKALKAGALNFIEKPFENEMLLNSIKEAMAGVQPNLPIQKGESEPTKNVADSVVQAMRLPFLVLDERMHIVSTNHALFDLFQIFKDGNEAESLEDLSHYFWAVPKLHEQIESVMKDDIELRDQEVTIDYPKAGCMTLLLSARQFKQENDQGKYVLILMEDISQRKRIEENIFLEKERAQLTLNSIKEAVITTDANGVILHLNPVAEKLVGWSSTEASGKLIDDIIKLVNDETEEVIPNPVFLSLQKIDAVTIKEPSKLVCRNGREIAVESTASVMSDKNGVVLGAVLVIKDITEQRKIISELAYSANHDPLTGLVNRREFEKRLQRAIDSNKNQGSQHTLCFIDLDKFKIINDTVGHAAGDELLRQVTLLFQKTLRERDTLARLGGDEFGLLFENCILSKAAEITEVMVKEVSDYNFYWDNRLFKIGASVGLVSVGSGAESPSDLLSQADVACYGAKRRGRSCVHIFHNNDKECTDTVHR